MNKKNSIAYLGFFRLPIKSCRLLKNIIDYYYNLVTN